MVRNSQEAFRIANAIAALEGYEQATEAKGVEARVIAGELTFDEAVKEYANMAKRKDSTKPPAVKQ